MSAQLEPLIADDYVGFPSKRALDYILKKRSAGIRGVGVYCTYAPVELIRAAGATAIPLCAYSNKTIPDAEKVLPSNLCPLIKSSYGFISTNTCPFFELSEAVIAETTCDGKKKMFELIASIKPMHIMDLPQVPQSDEALVYWTAMLRKLIRFLNTQLNVSIHDTDIEQQIIATNAKNRNMASFFSYAAQRPSVLSWGEMYDVIAMAQVASLEDLETFIAPILKKLDTRLKSGLRIGAPRSPRVLVTGCPVNGDSAKVLRIIEEAGGVITSLEGCSGMKPFMMSIDENSSDPLAALAKAYLAIPCSCMTPHALRLASIDTLIEKYSPDLVIDVILHACHAFNIESHTVEQHIKNRHGLPFLKIETDYATSDIERIRMRVEAVLERVGRQPLAP